MSGDELTWARILHVLSVIIWIGGTLGVALVAAFVARQSRRDTAAAVRQAVLRVATPAMLLAWLAGLWMLVQGWSVYYSKAGWMHGKLLVVLVMTGATGMITGRLRRASTGEKELGAGMLKALATVVFVLALIAVALVKLRPGG